MRRNVREKRRRLRWVKKLKRKIFWERKEGEGIGIVQIRRNVREGKSWYWYCANWQRQKEVIKG